MKAESDIYFGPAQSMLEGMLQMIDEQIAAMEAWVNQREDNDDEIRGFYDAEIDYLTGIGFVAIQHFITATASFWRIPKSTALDIGPYVPATEAGYAAVINAAANHWKHHEEWDKAKLRSDAERTVRMLNSVGVDADGAMIPSKVLSMLGVKTIRELVPQCVHWYTNLMELKLLGAGQRP